MKTGVGRDEINGGSTDAGGRDRRRKLGRVFMLLFMISVAALAWWQLGRLLRLEQLAEAETWLRNQTEANPVASGLIAFLVYIVVTGLSLPFALGLTLTISWLLGFAWAMLVISFGSTIGATLAMLASRYILRDWVRARLGKRFEGVLSRLDSEGQWYLASLRLAPPAPFFAVNLLAGLTRIGVRDYFWISQLCMLPATAIYCWTGAALPGLKQFGEQGPGTLVSPALIVGLCGMALLPLAIRFALRRFR